MDRQSEDYVAWCRFTGNNGPIVTCDSDAPGAFKVYRRPALNTERLEEAKWWRNLCIMDPQSYFAVEGDKRIAELEEL